MCAQKKRKKPESENQENEPAALAPIEIKRANTMVANKAHLASLGLEDKADKEARIAKAEVAKAEVAKAKQAARKQARIEQNWTALCRVGTRVKVPGQTFESAVPPVVPPEVTPLHHQPVSRLRARRSNCCVRRLCSAATGRAR